MKGKTFGIFFTTALVLFLVSGILCAAPVFDLPGWAGSTAYASSTVTYRDKDGNTHSLEEGEYTILNGEEANQNYHAEEGYVFLNKGTYVVETANDRIEYPVKFGSDVTLILCDGSRLNMKHIDADHHSLTVYGQNRNTGKLVLSEELDENIALGNVKDYAQYGCRVEMTVDAVALSAETLHVAGGTLITKSMSKTAVRCSGNITISGAQVTATGSERGSGLITDGNITISDSQVTATGGNGYGLSAEGIISISGGQITAKGGDYGSGISAKGNFSISGAQVTAECGTNGSAIGSSSGALDISDCRVTATGGAYGLFGNESITISGGQTTVTSDEDTGITSNGKITLSLTDQNDFILADSYYTGPRGTICVAEGKTIASWKGGFSGTIESADVLNGLTLRAPLSYVNENGERAILTAYEILTANETRLSTTEEGYALLNKGTYVIMSSELISRPIKLGSDTTVILFDGFTTSVSSVDADHHSLTIYGQEKNTGKIVKESSSVEAFDNVGDYAQYGGTVSLNVTGDHDALHAETLRVAGGSLETVSKNQNGICCSGNITISDAQVTATGGGNGIMSSSGCISISESELTATGGGNGIMSSNSHISISESKLTATGGENGYGVIAGGNISLGLTDHMDFIQVNRYHSESGTISVAEGKTLASRNGGFSGTIENADAINGLTLRGPCSYVNENGETVTLTTFDCLTGSEPAYDGFAQLTAETYVVNRNVVYETGFSIPGLELCNDVTLILCDGVTLDCSALSGQQHQLTIYGQKNNTGKYICRSSDSQGIFDLSGYVQYGGTVDLEGYFYRLSTKTFRMNGGILRAVCTGSDDMAYGIYCVNDVSVNGGQLTAVGAPNGIYSEKGSITLGLRKQSDFIQASSYHAEQGISVAEMQFLLDGEGGDYTGRLSSEEVSAIAGKKLTRPDDAYHYVRIASGITNGEITADKRAAVQNEIVTLTVKPAYGYELETLTVRDANDQDIPVTENTFTMPDADVTVSAVFKAISLSIGGVYTVPEGGASFLTLTLTGDTTILLTEGATLTVPGEINGENCTLTIQGTGTLDLCSENGGMHVKKLTIDSGRINGTITVSGENGVTITGGKIEGDISAERISISGGEIRGELVATGENGITITGGKVETDYIDSVYGVAICGGSVSGGSIYSSRSISISGGETTDSQIDGKTVNITSGVVSGSITGERISISGGKIRGSIVASSESGVSIIGGQVNAEYGISGWYEGGPFPLTLGCTLGNDYIYSDYYSYCSISIAKGQTLTDGVNLYTGTLTEEQISELPEKTLRRAYAIMIPESTAGGTVMADKGFVDPDDPDKSVTIIVTPDKGYALDTLTYTPADGTATDIIANAQGQYTFQMPAAIVTVTATFTPIDYTITKNAEHGSITARVGEDGDDADTAHYGETVTLTIAPDEDYTLDTLTVGSIDKTALVSDNQFSFTMPDTDLTVTAVFKPKFGTPDFVMPADLTMIEISAFEGNTKMTVVDARHCTTIGKDAFNGCTGLKQIRLPQNCTIHADAFTGCGTVFVFAPADGTTQTFCDDPNRTNLIFVPEMAGQ